MPRIVNKAALRATLVVIRQMDKVIRMLDALLDQQRRRRYAMVELARANYTGDVKSMARLAPLALGEGIPKAHYLATSLITRATFVDIQAWEQQEIENENEAKQAASVDTIA